MSTVILRQLAMLRQIPRSPAKVGTRSLKARLAAQGFEVSQRTIQRDLKQLSRLFPGLDSDGNLDAAGWFWKSDSAVLDFPAIDPYVALTFKLAELFLGKIFPPTMLQAIQPYFQASEEVLSISQASGLASWAEKVYISTSTQPLIPAPVEPEVTRVIYESLLKGRRFRGRYNPRFGEEAEYEIHPLGLVVRESVTYLVATTWEYTDPRQFALHRFVACKSEDCPANVPDGFSLQGYIASGAFEYVSDEARTFKLTALFDAKVAKHLTETPLGIDQVTKGKPDGQVQVTATVKDSQQLRWWLLGFGSRVEVIRPKRLRDEFAGIAVSMASLYS